MVLTKPQRLRVFFSKTLQLGGLARFIFSGDDGGGKPRASRTSIFFTTEDTENTEKRLGEKIKHRAKTLRRKVFLSGSHKATETQSFFKNFAAWHLGAIYFLAAATAAGSHERNRTKPREQAERRFFYHGKRGNTEKRLEEKIKHRAKTLKRKVFLSGSHKATETQSFFFKNFAAWRDLFFSGGDGGGKPRTQPNQAPQASRTSIFLPRKAREHGKEIGREIKHRAKTLRRKVFLSGSHKATETQSFFQKLYGLAAWRDSFLATATTAAGSDNRNRTKTREQAERRFFYHGRHGKYGKEIGRENKASRKDAKTQSIFIVVLTKPQRHSVFFKNFAALRLGAILF